MKVRITEEINIFELFVHDNEALRAIDGLALAEAINEHLDDWRVKPPEGLDRFTLYAANNEDEHYTDRYYSVEQVKAELPPDAIDQLEELNDMELEL